MKVIYTDIYDYCRWNKHANVTKLLNNHDAIDVLYKDGIYLKFALQNSNANILSTLLDYYYDQNGLRQKPETYNTEQQLAKHRLFEILQDVVISEDMQKVLDEYGLVQNDDNSSTHSNGEIEFSPIRKSHSMDDLKNHSNSKKSHSTHEHSDEELKASENLEFTKKLENDLFGHAKEVILDKPDMNIAGHLDDFTHSDGD